ncbi:signal transduction histidine kinase [Streptomyces caelestis]|uniref:Signal transduction histidine kinase n=1 Tax=Streptomyces caelestis TaxID=36816 RepID=A0A7W9LQE0_9ACTN|nr:signal transduction histidine kinase [Streptomyces caelestis]
MAELAVLIGDLQELVPAGRGGAGPRGGGRAARRRTRHGPDPGAAAGELTFTPDIRPWYVRKNPAALERALVDVLDNAVKFSPQGGEVALAPTEGGGTSAVIRPLGAPAPPPGRPGAPHS